MDGSLPPSITSGGYLRPEFRLRRAEEYAYLRESGKRFAGRLCVLVVAKPRDQRLRFGIITSRKYSKRAVDRNRARRLLREAYRRVASHLEPAWILLIPRYRMKQSRMPEVLAELERLVLEAALVPPDSFPTPGGNQ